MKIEFKLGILGALTVGMLMVACSDDETTASTTTPTTTATTSTGGSGGSTTSTTSTGGTGGGGGMTAPTLGTQVDRKGRPAINTALNYTFINTNSMASDDIARAAAEDAYNADDDPSGWAAAYTDMIKANLAILDGVDGTCTNQVGYGTLGNADYTTLATVLANDWLLVKGDAGTCNAFLGVEVAVATQVAPDNCGGRRPGDDVMDAIYGGLSGLSGSPATVTPFPDNVPVKTGVGDVATFPYLGPTN